MGNKYLIAIGSFLKRWYVIAALVLGVVAALLLALETISYYFPNQLMFGRGSPAFELFSPNRTGSLSSALLSMPSAQPLIEKYNALSFITHYVEDFPNWVVIPMAITGYIGFSLDHLYRWLRSKGTIGAGADRLLRKLRPWLIGGAVLLIMGAFALMFLVDLMRGAEDIGL